MNMNMQRKQITAWALGLLILSFWGASGAWAGTITLTEDQTPYANKGFGTVSFAPVPPAAAPANVTETVGSDIVLPAEVTRANYRGEAGAEVSLYRPEESARWVMTVTEPEGRPVTILLEGQPSALKPASLDYTTDFDGQPMGMTADQDRLYVRGTYEGRTLECVRDAKGARTMLDGARSKDEIATPGELESMMMLDEVAGRWEIMKQTVVSVDTNGLSMRGSVDAEARPRQFTRTGILSEEESKLMEEKLAAHEAIEDESKIFLTREQKLEETP